jgi:hypothetical protein
MPLKHTVFQPKNKAEIPAISRRVLKFINDAIRLARLTQVAQFLRFR